MDGEKGPAAPSRVPGTSEDRGGGGGERRDGEKDPGMLRNVLGWIGLFAVVFAGIGIADGFGARLPWYFFFLVAALFFPNVLFLRYALRRSPYKKLVVIGQAGIAAVLMYVAEILAIQCRFWGFFQDRDVLLGTSLGNVPLEEFLFYPLMFNVSLYGSLQAKSILKKTRAPLADAPPPRGRRAAGWAAAAVFAGAAVLLGVTASGETAERRQDRDAAGNPVYAEGPERKGWTVTMMAGMAVTAAAALRASRRRFLDWKAVFFSGTVMYTASLVTELLGIGRGWWVYNEQQILGFKAYILPLESFFMYFIGCVLPASLYEILREFVRGIEPRPEAGTASEAGKDPGP